MLDVRHVPIAAEFCMAEKFRDGPCADIFFEANLVTSLAARFKRTTKIFDRKLVHER